MAASGFKIWVIISCFGHEHTVSIDFLLGWGSGSDSRSKSARNMERLPKFDRLDGGWITEMRYPGLFISVVESS